MDPAYLQNSDIDQGLAIGTHNLTSNLGRGLSFGHPQHDIIDTGRRATVAAV